MKSRYKKIGDQIILKDVRNVGLKVQNLLGLSITKEFIPSVANIIGTDMENYKIIKKNQFACSTMQVRRDKKMPVALLKEVQEAIISQAYPIFEVMDESVLLPDYLMMWFSRAEFDREACFHAIGGVRGSLEWEDFCNLKLPIPSIDRQKDIVSEFKIIESRIYLNKELIQKLDQTARAIFIQLFSEGINLDNLPEGWRIGCLNEICEYSNRRIKVSSLNLENYISTDNMLQNKAGVLSASSLPTAKTVTNFEIGDILLSNIRPYFKKLWQATFGGGCSNDVLCFASKPTIPSLYLYQILEKVDFFEYVMAGSKGTKMPRGDKNWIMDYKVLIPSTQSLEKFKTTTNLLRQSIELRKAENVKLMEMQEVLLSRLATLDS